MNKSFSMLPVNHLPMFRSFFFLLFFALPFLSKAQHMEGVTGKPDTSYTAYSAYRSSIKDFPNAGLTVVKDSLPPTVQDKRNITYAVVNNQPLQLDVFYPKGKHKPLPAILIIHGGGWRSGNRTQHYALAERLAEKGYVCVTASYRLSTEALYPAAVQDLKMSIRWIRANAKTYGVDTSKVAVLGFSAGGQLAALISNTNGVAMFETQDDHRHQSSAVQAIIDIDGILAFIHPESGEGNDTKSTSAATYWFGYSKTENPELWKQASALSYAGPHTPPTLFLNSGIPRMHAGRDDYINIVSKYNIYTEVHDMHGPHAFCMFEPWFTPTVQYITAFLDKVFKK